MNEIYTFLCYLQEQIDYTFNTSIKPMEVTGFNEGNEYLNLSTRVWFTIPTCSMTMSLSPGTKILYKNNTAILKQFWSLILANTFRLQCVEEFERFV